ncbi:uncharacterized protein LOC135943513 [Cloeon dipterum]|uniref:uncharacterized protein LOC135943513 n=1 Tax=Cloeon dipterum TaxID=197152 RepID=UPI00321FFCD2
MEEDSDEEVLVLVQLSGMGIKDVLRSDPPPEFKIIGLEKNEPIIQIGPQFYAGKAENATGTYLFFKTSPFDAEKDYNDFDKDMQMHPLVWAEYFGKTGKVMKMKQIYPKDRSHVDPNESVNLDDSKIDSEMEQSF